uniref:MULE transposase domain-containing protein n=1 Tax=Oryza meridionalis TaxID=40149 RepID=A0A0E0C1B6_9ORYZ
MSSDCNNVPSGFEVDLQLFDYGSSSALAISAVATEHLDSCTSVPLFLEHGSIPEQPPIRFIDWDNLEIEGKKDDEGRIEVMTDDQLFELLGLSDENERATKSAQVDESNNVLELNGHAVIEGTEGAAIPVDDAIPGELVILWKEDVLKRSPGSIVEIDIKEVDGRPYFHRFFYALSPCIEGFVDGCRPYLSTDSTALNGKWNGHLASATSIDGHNWMYPVAFGFIDSESEDNWVWFMKQLHKAIGDLEPLAICSDACKGLKNAVQKVFHKAKQRKYFFHLMKNFAKRFHGDTFGNMYLAARAYRSVVFQKHMTPIINGSPEIRDYKDLHVVDLADKIRETILILWDKRRIGERLHGKRGVGRQRKLRIKGCLETSGKSSAKSDDKKKENGKRDSYMQRVWREGKRQPRKNTTKYPPEPSTPIMTTNRDTLMQESPGMVTRRHLAMLLGDSSGTTGEAGGNLGASISAVADLTGASTSGGNSSTIPKKKKLTPKRMKKT